MAMGIALLLAPASTYGQADALVDMLQKKGLLTQREANEVKDQLMSDIREQMPATKMSIGGWLDELKFGGDARVRYETSFERASPQTTGTFPEVDRTRFRYRLRFGATAKAGDWLAGLRLASGDTAGPAADAISTNTSFDQFGGKKPINVDLAYITYEPNQISGLRLTGGKFENTFWESDMVYDGDLTPEGFTEQYTYKFNDQYGLFANFGQWILAEDNTTANNGTISRGEDAFMYGFQVGHTWKIVPKEWELKQAVAIYNYEGLQNQAASAANTFTGASIRNSLTTTAAGTVVFAKDYDIFAINNELKIGILPKLPITLQGEYINNLAANEFQNGYKVGFKLWDAKTKGQYEVGYWYEYLEADANLSLFSDSDFGQGGTNTKGHILKAKYNMTDWASVGFAFWHVENVDDFIQASGAGSPGAGTAANNQMRVDDRIQVDIVMKF